VATAIKAANPELIVIDESGDGCMYGEGGNHFIHAIRRNPDITNIVHNNMVYGLTKGQASPTSLQGFKTLVQREGVFHEAFSPLAVAVSLGASFVARAFAGDTSQTKEIIKKAISHKGYALVDILQPCVTYNKMNTYKWFKENTYYLDASYDPHDRMEAFRRASEMEKLPLGIFYLNPKSTFEEKLSVYQREKILVQEKSDLKKLSELIHSKREFADKADEDSLGHFQTRRLFIILKSFNSSRNPSPNGVGATLVALEALLHGTLLHCSTPQ
jgi:2-oxoglutarate ferredoxin oxidoreductase subunit beta